MDRWLQVNELEPQLNDGQRLAYDAIVHAVEGYNRGDAPDGSRFFYLDAIGGSGKTFVLNLLLARVRAGRRVALAVATSGLASMLLQGGTTAHRRFKIPLLLKEDSLSTLSPRTDEARLIREAALIVWDEAPMAHKHTLEVLDRLLRELMRDTPYADLPFGGKVVVLAGDYRQLLPVVPRGTRGNIVAATHLHSYLWRHGRGVHRLRLSQNMRVDRLLAEGRDAEAQQDWAKWLLDLGGDTLPHLPVARANTVALPVECCLRSPRPRSAPTVDDLVADVFGNLREDPEACEPARLMQRAVLTPLNKNVDAVNQKVRRERMIRITPTLPFLYIL